MRVAVADRYPTTREGLRSVLGRYADLLLVGEAAGAEEARRLILEAEPDVLVLGLNLPAAESIALAGALAERGPTPRVVAFGAFSEEEHLFEMLGCRVAACVSKEEPADVLVEAIRAVAGGQAGVISPAVEELLQGLRRKRADVGVLTEQEREVLRLVALGYRDGEIVRALHVAPTTARNHVAHIYDKLDLHRRAEAVVWAWRHGLGDPG